MNALRALFRFTARQVTGRHWNPVMPPGWAGGGRELRLLSTGRA